MPPLPPKMSAQSIFTKITELKPEMNCVVRWKIGRIVSENIFAYNLDPVSLRYRLKGLTEAAMLLKEHGLPENTGNLKDHAFATALRAYNWLEQLRVGSRKSVDVTCYDVQCFAGLMGFHYNEFRRLGCTSYVCQGSVLGTLVELGQLEDFADSLA